MRARPSDFGVASLAAVVFAAILAALAVLRPASEAQRRAADPLVQLIDGRFGVWPVVALPIVAAVAWRRAARPSRSDAAWALSGVLAAVVVSAAIRALVGSRLPSFIPSEESARPGVTLGLAAGLLEEVVFRLAVLPLVFFALAKRIDRRVAALVAVLVTGALFSLSHELGPAGGAFVSQFMLTRLIVPGAAMSIVALRLNVTFLVCAHCTAHLLIPWLFPA